MVIVLGVDDSDQSVVAARRAVELGGALDAEVHALHILHIPGTVVNALSTVPDSIDEFAAAERGAVWARVGPVLDECRTAVKRVDVDGYPPDTIADYAKEVSARMIVVGSRGRGGIASLVLGSTSHRLLHIAHCDVLVAREKEK